MLAKHIYHKWGLHDKPKKLLIEDFSELIDIFQIISIFYNNLKIKNISLITFFCYFIQLSHIILMI
jgi:hypothetical protein